MFPQKRQRVKVESVANSQDEFNLLSHNVLLYKYPPPFEITIPEFEELALDRLRLLRAIERANNRNLKLYSEDWKQAIKDELAREGLKYYLRLISGHSNKEQDIAARKKDYISHFILRFAYCKSEDLKRWFVAREMELFKFKFASLGKNDVKEFVRVNNLKFDVLNHNEKSQLSDKLIAGTPYLNAIHFEGTDFYKIPFQRVTDLVFNRRCYLKAGTAYVASNDFVSIVASIHQEYIEEGLLAHLKMLPTFEMDERFSKILRGIHHSYTGNDYAVGSTEVAIENLDNLSKKAFPLCMRYCHEQLLSQHKLRHGGRLQYGLFLKGIGVTLEDALRFFKTEFCKAIDGDTFDKKYRYNIRYNYGKEGSRVNYTPFSCIKIIQSSVNTGDNHGCPYKTIDPSVLKTKFLSYGMSSFQIEEIISFVKGGHYQIACSKYMEITHGTKIDEGINHPNQYFERSQQITGDREKPDKTPQRGAVKKPAVVRKNKDDMKRLMRLEEDAELWETMTQFESQAESQMSQTQPKTQASEWEDDDDLDMSQLAGF